MEESIQNSGVINHQKRKSESNFPRTLKKSPPKIEPLRFYKIVSYYTKLLDYII